MNEIYLKVQDLEQSWNIKKYLREKNKDIVSVEDIIGSLIEEIEELEHSLEETKEELDTTKENIQEYYEPISPMRLAGMNESDFY